MATERERTWESRIWTISQALMVGAILWVGSTLTDLGRTVARIEERVTNAVNLQNTQATAQQTRDKVQDERIDALRRDYSDLQHMLMERQGPRRKP